MPAPDSVDHRFSLEDLGDHVENYGMDIYPPIDVPKETVRAQSFYLELRDRWPLLFENFTVGGSEFRMQTVFRNSTRQVPFITFNLTPRGPVFAFPRRLAVLDGDVPMGGEPRGIFEEALKIFSRTFPGRQIFRVGLVRNLLFRTGQTDCTPWLGRAVMQFGDARLFGAQCVLAYLEDSVNVRIQLEPVQMAIAAAPALGAVPIGPVTITGQNQFGLSVLLDVNNRDMRPLAFDDVQAVLERATELWPGRFLQFLNTRSLS